MPNPEDCICHGTGWVEDPSACGDPGHCSPANPCTIHNPRGEPMIEDLRDPSDDWTHRVKHADEQTAPVQPLRTVRLTGGPLGADQFLQQMRHWSESLYQALGIPTPQPGKEPDDSLGGDFETWWLDLVSEHAPTIQAKAEEYGTNSLVEVGRLYARARGRDQIEPAEAIELGCAVYAYGKIQRVIDACLKDRLPSEDTWRDAMVYAAMALYTREHGRWP